MPSIRLNPLLGSSASVTLALLAACSSAALDHAAQIEFTEAGGVRFTSDGKTAELLLNAAEADETEARPSSSYCGGPQWDFGCGISAPHVVATWNGPISEDDQGDVHFDGTIDGCRGR